MSFRPLSASAQIALITIFTTIALAALGWGVLHAVDVVVVQTNREARIGEGMVTLAYQLERANGRAAVALRNYVITANPSSLRELAAAQHDFEAVQSRLAGLPKGVESEAFLNAISALATQEQTTATATIDAVSAGHAVAAQSILTGRDDPLRARLEARIDTLIARRKVRRATFEQSLKTSETLTRTRLFGMVITLGLIAMLGWLQLQRRLVKPLLALECAAQRITDGEFSTRLEPGRNDEFGRVAISFNRMAEGIGAAITGLKETERYKDQFLGIASHEMRTPLNFIMGFASVLADDSRLLPDQRLQAARILEGSDRLLELVDDLLELANIRADKLTLYRQWADVAQLASAAAISANATAVLKHIRINANIPSKLFAEVDEKRLALVFRHLLSNAIKFTGEGGSIDLTVLTHAGQIEVEVCDPGIGINAKYLEKLFAPLEQYDMSSTRAHGGMGVGLAICKNLVAAHGGVLLARSELGVGTCLQLTLPIGGATNQRIETVATEASDLK